MTSPSQWTRIDPEVHRPEWFRGKGVTFLHGQPNQTTYSYSKYHWPTDDAVIRSTHFLLHPPLPDPLEEEIEEAAKGYWMYDPDKREREIATKAFIAGARAFLGRKA